MTPIPRFDLKNNSLYFSRKKIATDIAINSNHAESWSPAAMDGRESTTDETIGETKHKQEWIHSRHIITR